MLPRSLAPLSLAVGVLAVGLAAFAAWRQDSTYDEPFHLSWSQRLLETGETERESAERYNSKTPAALPNVLARKAAAALSASDPRALRFAARLPTVLWLAALLAATFGLARSLSGTSAATLATLAVALDPNLIAHGSLVTVDVVYALATLIVLAGALAYAREPTLGRGALLGLALGFAFAVKFTAVLLVIGLLALPLAIPTASRARWRDAKTLLASGLLAALLAILVVDAAYLGRRVGVPLREANLTSAPLARVTTLAPNLPTPLPASFLRGLDRSLGSERGWGPVVILGQAYPNGVFFYFAALWALKTPILLALAQLVGLLHALRNGALREPAWRFLFANLVLTLCYFSFLFKTQIGYRFVLMCVPIAWILAAPALAALGQGRPLARALGALALGVALAENLMYLGNPLAFTNAAVWPKRNAYRLVADSNVDWGQNRDKVADWLRKRGIPASRLDPIHVLPGPNVFSVNALAGVFDFDQHRWLRANAEPLEHWGHTYLRYEVDNETFDRFMDAERTYSPDATAAALCGDAAEYALYAPGSQVPFTRSTSPEPNRVAVFCLKADKRIDFGFRMSDGRIRFGRFKDGLVCDADVVQDEQVLWHRLAPGTHALCAIEIPNRRPNLPYNVEATLVVRGQAASLGVRTLASDARGAVVP